eukprot:c22633_g1_i1 orf=129-3290(+)
MASSFMLRPLCTSHLFYPSPSSHDRVCCAGLRRRRKGARPVFVLRCRRNWGLSPDISSLSVKLTASSARINGVILPQGNFSGQVNTVADASVDARVSGSQLVDTQPLSNENSADSNGSVVGPPPPAADPGPEFDYQVYAANTMVGYEPPPPPRIPFGGPFEDYYDEYIGVDYVPKQEKPTSSFLMFLDSLNEKRAEEEAKLREKDPSRPPFDPKPNKNLFSDNKPLFTISRPTHPAPLPQEYTPPSLDSTEPPRPKRNLLTSGSRPVIDARQGKPLISGPKPGDGIEYPVPKSVTLPIDLEDIPSKPANVGAKQSSVSSQTIVVEEFSPTSTSDRSASSGSPSSPQTRQSPDTLSPALRTSDEIKDSARPSSPQTAAGTFSPPTQTRSSEVIEASSAPFTAPSNLAKEPPRVGERSLTPQLRSTGDDAGGGPLSPSTRPLEVTSSRPLSPSTRPFEAPIDASGSLFPQSRPVNEVREDSRPALQQTRGEEDIKVSTQSVTPPSDVTRSSSETSSPATMPIEESRPFVPQSRPLEETRDEKPFIFQRKPIEESKPFVPQSRPVEEAREERPFIFQRRDMEESKPPIPQAMPSEEARSSSQSMSSQIRPSEQINGSGGSLFPQTRPIEPNTSLSQGRPAGDTFGSSRSAPQSMPFDMSRDDRQRLSPQPNGMVQPPPFSGQVASSAPALDGLGELALKSEYYDPNDGDIVLGVVTHADEDELSLEIGARVPALMTMRDFQPFTEVRDNSFFKLPLSDGSNETLEDFVTPPLGTVLLAEDKAANDGIYRGENVNIGTIVVAEVHSRALVEGRPVLTCRRLARSLGFVRIEQLMRTGESIQLEITQSNDGGLQGYLEGVRAFLPRSELLQRPESSAALQDYVGKTLTVAVLQAEEYSSNVIISEVKPWMSKNLLLGTVHDLTVTKIFPYGMQAEITNTRVRGFIHISSITRGYVTSVSAFFSEGEKIKGMVIRGRKPGQLSFSIEALEPMSDEGLVLRDKELVFQNAEEVALSSQECQLPIEERRIFTMPSASTSVTLRDNIANLPWLHLENLRNSS